MFDVLVHEAWRSVPQKMSLHVVCVQGNGSDVQLVNYPLFYLTDPVDESKLYQLKVFLSGIHIYTCQIDFLNK